MPSLAAKLWNNAGMLDEMAFPETIETERLVLRRYTSADAAGILELVEQNRGLLTREFPQMAKELIGVEEAKSFVEEKLQQRESRETFCYGIWRKSSKEQIGQIQAKNIAWEIPAAELGYFIGSAWQRRGYASESVAAILRVAFQELEFQRIFVRILPSNKESLSLAKKLGFQEEGLQRNAFRCGFGELHDVRYLSITAEDYRLPRGKGEKRNTKMENW